SKSIVDKIGQFCMVPSTHVISVHDVSNIYRVPLLLKEQNVHHLILNTLKLKNIYYNNNPIGEISFSNSIHIWNQIANSIDSTTNKIVRIGIVGKYTGLSDS